MYDFTRMSEINNYLILFFCFATAKKKQFHRFSFHPPVYGIFVTQRHRNLRFHSSIKKSRHSISKKCGACQIVAQCNATSTTDFSSLPFLPPSSLGSFTLSFFTLFKMLNINCLCTVCIFS